MEFLEDLEKLQSNAEKWCSHYNYEPDIASEIAKNVDPTVVNIWLPLIYWLIGNQRSLNRKGRYLNHSYHNPHRKFIYNQLRIAVEYCPLSIFKHIIKYTQFNQNELKSLITPTIPIDKFVFFVRTYKIKLCSKVLIGKLTLIQIGQLYDCLLECDYKGEISSKLYILYNSEIGGVLSLQKFKTSVLKESMYFKYMERKMDKNLVLLILSYL
jgi:hypothetical protein